MVRAKRTRTGAVGGMVAGSDTKSSNCTEGKCGWDSVNESVNTGIKNRFLW